MKRSRLDRILDALVDRAELLLRDPEFNPFAAFQALIPPPVKPASPKPQAEATDAVFEELPAKSEKPPQNAPESK